MRFLLLVLAFSWFGGPLRASALPRGANWIDVSKAPFNVRPFVQTPAFVTAQLNRALFDASQTNGTVFLPTGVYTLADTLRFDTTRATLRGESRSKTVLFLGARTPGFGDASQRKALLQCGAFLSDLTIEVGDNNAGAVGLEWRARMGSALRRVSLRGESGALGLDASGPAFGQDVEISGFRCGIWAHGEGASTWERVRLDFPAEMGFEVAQSALWIHDLRFRGRVPAVRMRDECTFFLLDRARFLGAGSVAIQKQAGAIVLRDVRSDGFENTLRDGDFVLRGPVDEWIGDADPRARRKRQTQGFSGLFVPAQNTPPLPSDEASEWVSVAEFGAFANDDRDDSRAVQRAVDALSDPESPHFGKTTILFPSNGTGSYRFSQTIYLHGNASRIEGGGSAFQTGDNHLFEIGDITLGTLWIGDFRGTTKGGTLLNHTFACDVVLRDAVWNGGALYRSHQGAGDVWMENVSTFSLENEASMEVESGQNLWLRAVHFEARRAIQNNGGRIWGLGLWFASGSPFVDNSGECEVLGAWNDGGSSTPSTKATFLNREGARLWASAVLCLDSDFHVLEDENALAPAPVEVPSRRPGAAYLVVIPSLRAGKRG